MTNSTETTNSNLSEEDLISLNLFDALKYCYHGISLDLDADIFLYSADISDEYVDRLINIIRYKTQKKPNCVLILSTYGGTPHAAYRLARIFQRLYSKFILFIFGSCKSAGTLVAIGADEIVMSDFAELGPLDVQVLRSDDLLGRTSGLDLLQSLKQLNISLYEIFNNCFINTLRYGAGAITTKTAADIASNLAVGLFSPVMAQIDPLRIGEISRLVKIAEDYGKRLNPDREQAIGTLISQYSSHSFVIDYDEAATLFGDAVRQPRNLELILERVFYERIRRPDDSDVLIVDLSKLESDEEHIDEESIIPTVEFYKDINLVE